MCAGGARGDRGIGHLMLTTWLLAALGGGPAVAFAQEPSRRIAPDIVLDLNLPAYRLEVLERGNVTQRYLVAIGARAYPTLVGDFTIDRLIWNPIWVPPESPWARGETITPPGPSNPMRKVKFQVDGPYYMHGTPVVSSLGHAASHGCIRMHPDDAIALARILQRRTGAAISEATTDSLARQSRPTREVVLPAPVLLRIRYELAEVRGDTLTVHPDVYRRMRGGVYDAVMTVLASAGIDTTRVARDAVRGLLARAARQAARIPLDSILDTMPAPRERIVRRRGATHPVRNLPTSSSSFLDGTLPGCPVG
jgi:hypothetical protein